MFLFRSATTRQSDLALLILRVAAGLTMAAHGWQKVFVYGFSGVAGSFGQMGVPMADILGPIVAVLELVGGIALALGLFTRIVAVLLAADMLGAVLLVHLPNGFFAPKGAEFTLLLLGIYIAFSITGAGSIAVDSAIEHRHQLA